MTIVVTHTTPADSSFSTEGAAAWNADHALSGVGTMAEQNANSVAITGGGIDNTVIGNTTPNAATFTTLTATGQTSLGGAAGSEGLRVTNTASSANWLQAAGSTTGNLLTFSAQGADTNVGMRIQSKGTGIITFSSNSSEQLRISGTASAVNYVQVTGNATNAGPVISAQGSDTNVDLLYSTKGTGGSHVFRTNGTVRQFQVNHVTSAVNYATVTGSAANFEPVWGVAGSDTNISMAFQSKGTGAIDLAAGSSGVNISNGGTVTAITKTVTGSGYSSVASVAVSAPTTAGGVQATATCTMRAATTAPIISGGTGYTVGDVLTFVGGTFVSAIRVTVATVSSGVITSVTSTAVGEYSALPSAPISVTGGTGTGATFSMDWGVANITVATAGSGYVEQPTVTFSGGGGSGAAAYATVGSGTTVQSLGSTMSFRTPGGENFRVRDAGSAVTDFPFAIGSSFGRPVLGAITTTGSGSSALALTAYGTSGVIQLMTNNTAQEQMRVSHTASAVNYVQVTGAATGNDPVISAQGSDTDARLIFRSKGSRGIQFQNSASNIMFATGYIASSVNYLQANPSTANTSPALVCIGSDTNIGLNLTTKGTGAVNLNTGNGLQLRVNDTFGTVASGNWWEVSGRGAGSAPLFGVAGETNTSAIFYVKGTGTQRFATGAGSDNGNGAADQFRIAHTASAVNYVQVTGAATTGTVSVRAEGSDSGINLGLSSKGAGAIRFYTDGLTSEQFRVNRTAGTIVNRMAVTGSTTGNAPVFSVEGTDTNIDLALTPKGTGLVRFGTYTAGAPTATGYISIKAADGTTYKVLVGT